MKPFQFTGKSANDELELLSLSPWDSFGARISDLECSEALSSFLLERRIIGATYYHMAIKKRGAHSLASRFSSLSISILVYPAFLVCRILSSVPGDGRS